MGSLRTPWCGEAAPNSGKANVALPPGYSWDICATRAVELLKVKNGKVVTPGGVEYEILVLPSSGATIAHTKGVVSAFRRRLRRRTAW